MKCTQCLYEDNCSIRDFANDITGCEGHSKVKPSKEGQIQCICCKGMFDRNIILMHEDKVHNLCSDCYSM